MIEFYANGETWWIVDPSDGHDPDHAVVVSSGGDWYPVRRALFFHLDGLVSSVLINWLFYYRLDFVIGASNGSLAGSPPPEDEVDDTEIEPEDLGPEERLGFGVIEPEDLLDG
jgi:hypothetical protein